MSEGLNLLTTSRLANNITAYHSILDFFGLALRAILAGILPDG
jgi:hypothetical protein